MVLIDNENRFFIETQSGRQVWLPACDPQSIDIEDIAHALSHAARFSGHLREFYSVAEHSIHVASLCSHGYKLQGLLHDAPEAYLADVATPFKRQLSQYQALEDDLWGAVCVKFRLDFDLHESVKRADQVMLMTERDALKDVHGDWGDEYESVPRVENWRPLRMCFGLRRASPRYVRDMFIERFKEYRVKEIIDPEPTKPLWYKYQSY